MTTLERMGRVLLGAMLLVAGLTTIVGSGGGGSGGGAEPTPNPTPNPVPNSAPTITTQPAPASVSAPATATFSVVATGNPQPTYQWQLSTDNGANFGDILGATSASFTTGPSVISDSGRQYRVAVSNVASSVVSSPVVLTVTAAASATRFLYMPSDNNTAVRGYTIGPSTGALTPTPGSPYAVNSGNALLTLTVHPSGNFLYGTPSADRAGTSVFRIDPTSGALTLVELSQPAPALQVVIEPRGRFIFMVGGSAGIAAFKIDTAAGTLTPAPGSPFREALTVFSRLAIDSDGRFAYLRGQNDSLHAYAIDQATGALTHVPGSPVTLPLYQDPVVRPGGGFVFLRPIASGIVPYAVDQVTGALSALAAFPSFNSTAATLDVHPNGKCLFVSTGTSVDPLIFDPATGRLVESSVAPLPLTAAGYFTLNPSAIFGYVALPGSQALSNNAQAANIDSTLCGVALAPGGRIGLGRSHQYELFDPDGKFAFGTTSVLDGIYSYTLDPITHQPQLVPGSPFPKGGPSLVVTWVIR